MANPAWQKGMKSPNPNGAPRKDGTSKTNKDLRTEELSSMLNKLKPGLGKAIRCAIEIIEGSNSTESGKLRASALVITTCKELTKELYSEKYDDDEGKELDGEDDKAPVFSLRMIEQPEDK